MSNGNEPEWVDDRSKFRDETRQRLTLAADLEEEADMLAEQNFDLQAAWSRRVAAEARRRGFLTREHAQAAGLEGF
jgi:hypothetical protein